MALKRRMTGMGLNGVLHVTTKRFDLQSFEKLLRLQSFERLGYFRSLGRLSTFSSLKYLHACSGDYQKVEILPDSVIYCDIPYKGTKQYGPSSSAFDYSRFYDWALSQKEPVFISEYSMPSDFECIAEIPKNCSLSATNNACQTVERLFVPKGQKYMTNRLF